MSYGLLFWGFEFDTNDSIIEITSVVLRVLEYCLGQNNYGIHSLLGFGFFLIFI